MGATLTEAAPLNGSMDHLDQQCLVVDKWKGCLGKREEMSTLSVFNLKLFITSVDQHVH